jgi:hypothetical protein
LSSPAKILQAAWQGEIVKPQGGLFWQIPNNFLFLRRVNPHKAWRKLWMSVEQVRQVFDANG